MNLLEILQYIKDNGLRTEPCWWSIHYNSKEVEPSKLSPANCEDVINSGLVLLKKEDNGIKYWVLSARGQKELKKLQKEIQ